MKVDTETLDVAQDVLSGVLLQVGKIGKSEDQDRALQNICSRMGENIERGRRESTGILGFQVA